VPWFCHITGVPSHVTALQISLPQQPNLEMGSKRVNPYVCQNQDLVQMQLLASKVVKPLTAGKLKSVSKAGLLLCPVPVRGRV